MPKILSAAEAKTHLGEALRLAEAGEVVEITRYGKPVAALVGAARLAEVRRLEAAKTVGGLGSLAGRYEDGEDFARLAQEVVEARSVARPLPKLD
jgi:prevent-host-death family protein